MYKERFVRRVVSDSRCPYLFQPDLIYIFAVIIYTRILSFVYTISLDMSLSEHVSNASRLIKFTFKVALSQ